MAHAEALLFVDNQQAEILKLDVLRKQPVRADQNVHLAGRHALHNVLLLFCCSKARNHFHVDGELREPLLEGLEMLEAQDRGRRQHRNLLAVLHCFEPVSYTHLDVYKRQPWHAARRPKFVAVVLLADDLSRDDHFTCLAKMIFRPSRRISGCRTFAGPFTRSLCCRRRERLHLR